MLGRVPGSSQTDSGRHARAVLTALIAVLAIACALAPAALAASVTEGNAFGELTGGGGAAQSSTATTSTATTGASTSTESSTSTRTVIWIVLGIGIALLAAIAAYIVRDARRVAPATDGDMLEETTGRDMAVRMRKRRAKAKAARKQRKRNR